MVHVRFQLVQQADHARVALALAAELGLDPDSVDGRADGWQADRQDDKPTVKRFLVAGSLHVQERDDQGDPKEHYRRQEQSVLPGALPARRLAVVADLAANPNVAEVVTKRREIRRADADMRAAGDDLGQRPPDPDLRRIRAITRPPEPVTAGARADESEEVAGPETFGQEPVGDPPFQHPLVPAETAGRRAESGAGSLRS